MCSRGLSMRHKLIGGSRPWSWADYSQNDTDENMRENEGGKRRSKSRISSRARNRPVRVIYDPTGIYPRGGLFSWPDFRLTARRGYWPEGAVFEIKSRGRGRNSGCFAGGKPTRTVKIIDGMAVDVRSCEVLVPATQAYKWALWFCAGGVK